MDVGDSRCHPCPHQHPTEPRAGFGEWLLPVPPPHTHRHPPARGVQAGGAADPAPARCALREVGEQGVKPLRRTPGCYSCLSEGGNDGAGGAGRTEILFLFISRNCPDSEISFPPLLSQVTLPTHPSLSHGARSFRASSLRFGISQGVAARAEGSSESFLSTHAQGVSTGSLAREGPTAWMEQPSLTPWRPQACHLSATTSSWSQGPFKSCLPPPPAPGMVPTCHVNISKESLQQLC